MVRYIWQRLRGGQLENGWFEKKEAQGVVAAQQDMSSEKGQEKGDTSWSAEGPPLTMVPRQISQAVNPSSATKTQKPGVQSQKERLRDGTLKEKPRHQGNRQRMRQLCAMPTCSTTMTKSFQAAAE